MSNKVMWAAAFVLGFILSYIMAGDARSDPAYLLGSTLSAGVVLGWAGLLARKIMMRIKAKNELSS
jgi:hypothetical protein